MLAGVLALEGLLNPAVHGANAAMLPQLRVPGSASREAEHVDADTHIFTHKHSQPHRSLQILNTQTNSTGGLIPFSSLSDQDKSSLLGNIYISPNSDLAVCT